MHDSPGSHKTENVFKKMSQNGNCNPRTEFSLSEKKHVLCVNDRDKGKKDEEFRLKNQVT